MIEMTQKGLKKAIKNLKSHAVSQTSLYQNSMAQSEQILTTDKLLNLNTGFYILNKVFKDSFMIDFWDLCDHGNTYSETSYIELDTSNSESSYKDSLKTSGITYERDLVLEDKEEIVTKKIEIKFMVSNEDSESKDYRNSSGKSKNDIINLKNDEKTGSLFKKNKNNCTNVKTEGSNTGFDSEEAKIDEELRKRIESDQISSKGFFSDISSKIKDLCSCKKSE